MADDLGELFDSDPGFLEELAGMQDQTRVTPIQNQVQQQPQGYTAAQYGNVRGNTYGNTNMQYQNVPQQHPQFSNKVNYQFSSGQQAGQNVLSPPSDGLAMIGSPPAVGQGSHMMVSPSRAQFASPPSGLVQQQQGTGPYNVGTASPISTARPHPQNQQPMVVAQMSPATTPRQQQLTNQQPLAVSQMRSWNPGGQMYDNQQGQGTTAYLSHHDYAMPTVRPQQIPVGTQQMPTQQIGAQQMPIQQMPTQIGTQQMPTQQMATQQIPTQQMDTQQIPTQQTTTQQIPTQQMATQQSMPTQQMATQQSMPTQQSMQMHFTNNQEGSQHRFQSVPTGQTFANVTVSQSGMQMQRQLVGNTVVIQQQQQQQQQFVAQPQGTQQFQQYRHQLTQQNIGNNTQPTIIRFQQSSPAQPALQQRLPLPGAVSQRAIAPMSEAIIQGLQSPASLAPASQQGNFSLDEMKVSPAAAGNINTIRPEFSQPTITMNQVSLAKIASGAGQTIRGNTRVNILSANVNNTTSPRAPGGNRLGSGVAPQSFPNMQSHDQSKQLCTLAPSHAAQHTFDVAAPVSEQAAPAQSEQRVVVQGAATLGQAAKLPGTGGSLRFQINTQPGQRIQLVRGPAPANGGPQKIFIIQQQQGARAPGAVVAAQQQPVLTQIPVPVSLAQQVTAISTTLTTVPQSTPSLVAATISGGDGEPSVAGLVPSSAASTGPQEATPSQQQEKANKIIAEAIAKAQKCGSSGNLPRVLSPTDEPDSTNNLLINEDAAVAVPAKKKKKSVRRKKKEGDEDGAPPRKKKKKQKAVVEADLGADQQDGPAAMTDTPHSKPKAEKTHKKKPPATLLQKRKKKNRDSESDSEMKFTPTPTQEIPDELMRRSGRHTERKKYNDDLDLNLSEDDDDADTGPLDVVGGPQGTLARPPAQIYVETPAEEDAVIVEKILGSRIRHKDVDVEDDDDEEDDVEEFYVKYKNFSYLHCEWKTENELNKDKRIAGKIRRYKRKKELQFNCFALDDDLFNPEYVEVDRVLEESVTEDPATHEQVTHYLVKWRGLPYEDSTWELQQDVDPEKVRLFNKLKVLPPIDERKFVERPENADDWAALPETPVYKGGNVLREYQLEGVNWLTFSWYKKQNCILADEMGLGKTIQSISFLHQMCMYGIRGPFLIVVPLSTIANWQREFETWTDMNVIVYHGTSPSRYMLQEYEMYYRGSSGQKLRLYKFVALITTYEIVIADLEVLRAIDWRCIIIDEAHRLKNMNCRLHEGLRALDFEHKVLLSGTPLQNNMEELFSLLNFLEPSQFNSSQAFLAEFGTLQTKEQVEKLKAILKPMMLRRLKEDVEKNIAAKEETIIEVELTNTQKKFYRAILEKNFSFLYKGTSSAGNVPNLMNTMMELRKCCNHPYLINGAEENILGDWRQRHGDTREIVMRAMIQASGKMVLLDKLLPKLLQGGHKVLIFSQMIRVLDIIEDYLINKRYLYERLDGRIRGNLRQEAIDRFSKPDSDRFVFLLCTRAGGLGINLTAADTVIIYDSDWNPQNDLQAQARCHRIGQTKMVKVYRLITRNSYEREMFDRASKKLGLDKAVLQDMGGDKLNEQPQLSRREIEDLLRKGAYGALMDDDNVGDEFCEEDIDQILQRRTQVIQIEAAEKGSTFAKASFSVTGTQNDIDVNDPEFWQKWAKKADVNTDNPKTKELIMEEPRMRKKTSRYGNNDGITNMSDLDTSSGSDEEKKERKMDRRRRKPVAEDEDFETEGSHRSRESRSVGYGRSELFKVEKGLLVYGWGRWTEIIKHSSFKRHMEVADVEKVARAILIYSLQYYKGDERIKEFIWDLVSPSNDGSLKNHCGLSAPVPRGRKGKKAKVESFNAAEELLKAGMKLDPELILNDGGYKKHLHRHSNKVLLRVRTLYYVKQEVIGDLAEQVDRGVNVREINIMTPPVEGEAPTYWWDEDADKSLLIGVYKHGYERYNVMRQDAALVFLARCGPPDAAALARELKDDDDNDDLDKDDRDVDVTLRDDDDDESLLAPPDTAVASTAAPPPAPRPTDDDGGTAVFPSISDLNTRLRKIITNFQRDYKKQQLKLQQRAKKVEKRERMDAMCRERDTRRHETQMRWNRREETEFYRVVATYGIEFDRHTGRYIWDKFRVMARLDKKTEEQLTEYFISFYHMCLRVCRKIGDEAYPPTPMYVEAITEERASRCIARIDLLSKIREEVLVNPRLEERLDACKVSSDLPSWWVCGKHDHHLMVGAARHGLARTDYFIMNDPSLSFLEATRSLPNTPAKLLDHHKDSPSEHKTPTKDADLDKTVKTENNDEADIKPDVSADQEGDEGQPGACPGDSGGGDECLTTPGRVSARKDSGCESDHSQDSDCTEHGGIQADGLDGDGVAAGNADSPDDGDKVSVKQEPASCPGDDGRPEGGVAVDKVQSRIDLTSLKDDPDEEVRHTFHDAGAQTKFLTRVTESLSTAWPKDRVIFHRLEQICYCVETGEWPFPKKMSHQHIMGIDSGKSTPRPLTPSATQQQEDDAHDVPAGDAAARQKQKDFEVQIAEGEGLKMTFHKKLGKVGHRAMVDLADAEKAARIQQILAESAAASAAASSDESQQGRDSPFLNGSSPTVKAELAMNKHLWEQGLLFPERRRRGRKRKAEKLAEVAMAEALSRRQTARAIATLDPESHVPVVNLEDGSRLSGDEAPRKHDIDAWLAAHPGYVVDQPPDLEDGEIIVSDERRRGRKPKVDPAFLDMDKLTGEENVSVINRLTGKKITGAKAPPLRYLAEWLEQNPMWDVDPKWADLVRAKGSLPKMLLPRVVTGSRRGRRARDSPLGGMGGLMGTDMQQAAALAASMDAMNAASMLAAGYGGLSFGSLSGLGLTNQMLGLPGYSMAAALSAAALSSPVSAEMGGQESPKRAPEKKGEEKMPHATFPLIYNPLLCNPLLASQGIAPGLTLPSSRGANFSPGLYNGVAASDSEEEPAMSASHHPPGDSPRGEQNAAEDLSVKAPPGLAVENRQAAHAKVNKHRRDVTAPDPCDLPCDLSVKSKDKPLPLTANVETESAHIEDSKSQTKIFGSDKLSRIVDSLKDRVNKMDDIPAQHINIVNDKKPNSLPGATNSHATEQSPEQSVRSDSMVTNTPVFNSMSQKLAVTPKYLSEEPVPQIVQGLLASKRSKDGVKKEHETLVANQLQLDTLLVKQSTPGAAGDVPLVSEPQELSSVTGDIDDTAAADGGLPAEGLSTS